MRNITVIDRILSEWKKINKLEEKNKQQLWMSKKDQENHQMGKWREAEEMTAFLLVFAASSFFPVT